MPLRTDLKKVLVIGSGPIVIGQAAEFDYAGTQACLALKEENIEVVLVNNNPATIMTDEQIADHVYIEPLTPESIEKIIQKEKPQGLIGTLGGQTGLNLTVALSEQGILEKYNVELLGTSLISIQKGEDREMFRQLMLDIEEPICESEIIHSFEEGKAFVEQIGYPVIIRPAYTLGGAGGGFANNEEELKRVLTSGLSASPIHQVLIEKSIKGWKEIEYEVMRDANDTCIIVCNMENMDPVGVHTGDSIVVAPSQTLTDNQYQMLRASSLKIIRALGIVGGCNIQFALDPVSEDYVIIEVNPRVSRSSALASKATGYPIARMAAKCAIGFHLDELLNPITGNTYASFEPALDYIVVKLPRFPFDKFTEADRKLGTQMKATGEVMAIDRTFEGALNKGLRSLELGLNSLEWKGFMSASADELKLNLTNATDLRLFAIAELLKRGESIETIHALTQMDPWFLYGVQNILTTEKELSNTEFARLTVDQLKSAKRMNISDARLAQLLSVTEKEVSEKRKGWGILPVYKLVDTCAGEFVAETPYYYSTWHGEDEALVSNRPKILVVGSGPIRIGQGVEFDYCSVHATFAVKKLGFEAVVVNNNPETVSTDYATADRLYFDPLTLEDLLHVIEKENVQGVLLQFGGQTAVNLAEKLEAEGVPILGTTADMIDALEDRERFYKVLKELNIPHIQGEIVESPAELKEAAGRLGFPILSRPSYVIGGQSMFIFYDEAELDRALTFHFQDDRMWPLLVDSYLPGMEFEVDAVSDGSDIVIPGIFEHVERAGVHSGDSTAIFPPVNLPESVQQLAVTYTEKICKACSIKGLMNIQFVYANETLYVLEVNPRASRTIPIISKVTGFPMVEAAVRVQLGQSVKSFTKVQGLLTPPAYYSVKAPVFSSSKLNGVDPVLGPEMKSTGESLGLGYSVGEALTKAVFLGEANPFSQSTTKKTIICSINSRELEESYGLIKELIERGFDMTATAKTAEFYEQKGLPIKKKVLSVEEVAEVLQSGEAAALINSPTNGRNRSTFGFQIRAEAIRHKVPLMTSLDTVRAALTYANSTTNDQVKTLTAYRQDSMKGSGIYV
ncbi:carbamoyl-phosphate synthase (glutamine-hydrolyzing) large subunit [Pullulanibacillus sp. KACC 23026]|uniref:carbamoyl-phosphate synthase (glutamine-hydrolyzing) large subunit n=1 Tax=Pullulanibacillus sp. KACC 23026 TaxID=3028315 RepID=UPI0023B0F9F2|nr:carbamoyl-phosphate synthase (glutamine-hydrolyzing) large subunit [Pullulanibacillus sp. KACC 23026]WEG13068.1 carbamoyl-phosphate synthase (glutamine-hydrolyzing) large subunit [Pullulanibacillus sp. KACC 23026]